MFKRYMCTLSTNDKSDMRDVVVKSLLPCKKRDLAIGGGLLIAGVLWLMKSTFSYAVDLSDLAECKVMQDMKKM